MKIAIAVVDDLCARLQILSKVFETTSTYFM